MAWKGTNGGPINAVSIVYLFLTGCVLGFMMLLVIGGGGLASAGELLRYWFVPWMIDLSHAFGFESDDFMRRLLLVAALIAVAGYVVRCRARHPVLKVVGSVVGVIGVIDWFALVVFLYLAMHTH